jgi:hypothetical protein
VPAQSPAAETTLVPLLAADMVPWETLEERYDPLLKLVRVLLGVVPNCDRYLEIWPPAFRTYNIMVPNLLDLPFLIFGAGGAPGDAVGLGMYASSRAAECPYCSAHSCSFALRRGASPEQVAQALVGDGAALGRGELATIAVARSLARIPCELTPAERDELLAAHGPRDAEWIVLAVAMMGFLNKFMNTIGVELEQPVHTEVAGLMGAGWSPGTAGAALDPDAARRPPPPADGLATKLRVLPLLPPALLQDKRWQRGVPTAWPAVGAFLRERTGHDFPILSRLHHGRAVQSIASMLRENLDGASTVVACRPRCSPAPSSPRSWPTRSSPPTSAGWRAATASWRRGSPRPSRSRAADRRSPTPARAFARCWCSPARARRAPPGSTPTSSRRAARASSAPRRSWRS